MMCWAAADPTLGHEDPISLSAVGQLCMCTTGLRCTSTLVLSLMERSPRHLSSLNNHEIKWTRGCPTASASEKVTFKGGSNPAPDGGGAALSA